uniref:B-cell receptor CD22-like n=1 Tax=Semicossyphus pulcher TaxID=241346 RepID=UPI0037E85B18
MNGNEPVDLRTDSEYSGRVQYHSNKNVCTLTVTDVRESDSADYKFRLIANQPDPDLHVKMIQSTAYRGLTWAELKCHSSCRLPDRPSYVWYRNGRTILKETSSFSGSFYPADSFTCALKGHEGFPSPAVYAPKLPSVSVSPSAKIVEGTSVTLTCSSDANPAARYTWYKIHGPRNSHNVSSGPELVFRSIQASDSGEYYCTAENELGRKTSTKISVSVEYAPKLAALDVSPTGEIRENSSVNLTCSSDANPAAKYTWYKENQTLPKERGQTYHFTSISSEDRGTYYCKSENVHGWKRKKTLSFAETIELDLKAVTAAQTEDAEEQEDTSNCLVVHRSNQSCSFSSPAGLVQGQNGWRVTYSPTKICAAKGSTVDISCTYTYPSRVNKKDNKVEKKFWFTRTEGREYIDVETESKYSGRVQNHCEGNRCTLTVTDLRESDSAVYMFRIMTNQDTYSGSPGVTLSVTDAPKLPSVSVSPSAKIVEGTSVTLTCSSEANPAARYTWYKSYGPRNSHYVSSGPELVFRSIQASDSGEYYCKAENELGRKTSTKISVSVEYSPKLPSVSVSPSAEIVEGSSVNLTCSSDANPAAKYTWYKEHDDSPKASGQIFTITEFTAEHFGNYYCEAKNTRGRHNSTLHLIVAAGGGKLPVVAGTITVVLVVIVSLLVFLWIRKRRASNESSEAEERPGIREQGQPEEQEDLQYASIHFSNKQTDPDLYYNIRPARPHRHMEQQEDTEYTAVKFNRASTTMRSRGQETGEDPAALYSTVNKTR